MKRTGIIPPEHYSHDHLNEQRDVPIEQDTFRRWHETFTRIQDEREKEGEKIIWVLVDGFLLFWHPVSARFCESGFDSWGGVQEVIELLDVRIFLRVPHDVLKKRRNERHGYHTAGRSLVHLHPPCRTRSSPASACSFDWV